jgi:hypothetical protein
MKLPIRASTISHVTMNPQIWRRITDDRKFIVVAKSEKDEDRNVELHLTDDEAHKLQLDLNEYLNDKPTITRIVTYE